MTEEDAARIQEKLARLRSERALTMEPNELGVMHPQFQYYLLEPGSNRKRGAVSASHTKRSNRSRGAASGQHTKWRGRNASEL